MQVPKLVDRYMAGNTRLDKYITHELPFEQVCCPAPPAPPHPAPPQPRPTPRRADLPPVSHSANLAVPELLESETDLPSCSSCVASSRSIFHFSKDMAAGRCRNHRGIVEKQIMHCTNCLCLPAIELLVGTLTARPGESCCRPGSCA